MSERAETKRLGARQTKNSGRGIKKGDATWENFTVDFKEYPKGFTINQDKKTRLAIIELSLLEQLLED